MTRTQHTGGRTTYVAPTSRMVSYMLSLARERRLPEYGDTPDERAAFLQRELDERRLSKYGAMHVIDLLKAAPRDDRAGDDALRPGVYRRNGDVFVVKLNRAQTALYAKRLVQIGGRRLTEDDDVVKADFEYAPGALSQLRPDDLMTLEQAREYLVRYTHCMVCGRLLRDATSVLDSIGPVCRKMFAEPPREEDPAEVEARTARLEGLLARLRES